MSASARAAARATGERVRALEQITRLRGLISGLELSVRDGFAPTIEAATAVANAGITLVSTCARLDTYDRIAHAERGEP